MESETDLKYRVTSELKLKPFERTPEEDLKYMWDEYALAELLEQYDIDEEDAESLTTALSSNIEVWSAKIQFSQNS